METPTTIEELHKIPCLVIEYAPLKKSKAGDNWQANYYLNIPMRDYDARRYDHKKGYIKVKMGKTNIQTSSPDYPIRGSEIDLPFRDGAHIQWDAMLLKLPMYKVYNERIEPIEFYVRGSDSHKEKSA